MTMNDNIPSFKDIEDGEVIENIDTIIFFDDEKEDGEIVSLVSIKADNKIYAGNSSIIARKLLEICELFKNEDGIIDEPFSIIKASGKTKNGRDFATISLI